MKKIRRIILGLVLLVVMVIVVGLFGIDLLAKMGVEKGATYALGVETTVGSLDLSVFGGSLEMEKLRIANPEGFSAPVFVESGKFSLRMDPSSVFSDTIEVNDFELVGGVIEITVQELRDSVGSQERATSFAETAWHQ